MRKIIHINRNVIQHNSKHQKKLPVCRIQEGKKTRYAMEVDIKGPSRMVYDPDNPLKCGAKLWIETEADVDLIEEMPWPELREAMKLK